MLAPTKVRHGCPLEVGLWRVDGETPVKVAPSGVLLESQLELMVEADPRYAHAALNHPCGSGYHVRNDDMQRPSSTTTSTCADATSSALPTWPWPASTAARHQHSRRVTDTRRCRRILLHRC
jgi:hypothetical protein